jgi:hypothetical protein
MNDYLARLNPAERRFVIGVAVLFFIVINFFWVWPHFSDWDQVQRVLGSKRALLANYQAVIQQQTTLEAELRKLAGQGPAVPPEDQASEFFRTVNSQASKDGVIFIGNSRSVTRTNQFFVEWTQTVQVQAGEKQLVDFLYHLGSDDSMIRVRALSVHPDASRQQLNANITLVASYQRNPRAAAAAAAPAPLAARSNSPPPRSASKTPDSTRSGAPAPTRPFSPPGSSVVKTGLPPGRLPIARPPPPKKQ